MKEFRLNKDKLKQPSDEDIAKYKDFASVAHGYQRMTKRTGKRLYQDPKFFIFIFLILLILLLVYLDSQSEGEESNGTPPQVEQES
jgi:lipopolysaccharide/colanic/teichoic acid biosynthesis glycosyltransferase